MARKEYRTYSIYPVQMDVGVWWGLLFMYAVWADPVDDEEPCWGMCAWYEYCDYALHICFHCAELCEPAFETPGICMRLCGVYHNRSLLEKERTTTRPTHYPVHQRIETTLPNTISTPGATSSTLASPTAGNAADVKYLVFTFVFICVIIVCIGIIAIVGYKVYIRFQGQPMKDVFCVCCVKNNRPYHIESSIEEIDMESIVHL